KLELVQRLKKDFDLSALSIGRRHIDLTGQDINELFAYLAHVFVFIAALGSGWLGLAAAGSSALYHFAGFQLGLANTEILGEDKVAERYLVASGFKGQDGAGMAGGHTAGLDVFEHMAGKC